jgi:predicted MPP superfamily phosphohydrolase
MLDLLKLPLWSIYKGYTPLWQRSEARVVLGTAMLAAIYVIGRVYSDTCRVRVGEQEWPIANLPAELDGLRIVHISDIHADARTDMARIEAYIERVNALKPDLAVFTGDLITWGTEYVEVGARMIGRIQARYGVYACIGDHDYWTGQEYVADNLRRQGVMILEDERTSIPVESTRIDIAGVTNIYSRHPRTETLEESETPPEKGTLAIFITHQPSVWLADFANERGYHLFLAGHTHGGQVVLRWPGIALTPVMRETPYLSGFYEVGRMLISVNNGLGLTLAPIRYQAPAEVTLIRIRRRFKKIF